MPTKRIVVYHDTYGCDTGCCGHVVNLGDNDKFTFDHPDTQDETNRDFVERIVTEQWGEAHVADIDWDAVIVVND